ncbi:MAG: TOBE domain-containing protein [Chromatiaceae bacterium]|nr:TOBE domain-containing protein [Chromatiaceae bacterium]MBP6733836.1 TOBE domain-containing protein [Chromatiaceae bacterium]MBP6807308.1 TOBE domain-containing protein [Chromatiaceae bacterium]MBP8282447.1 TOBE domain-containing protein [Chromatiaceae bacterium]MBP8289095.1 TOBE domain-containing protein [Chromatiaceae bacterium]
MSRQGNCWDHAPTESWFNSFENENAGVRVAHGRGHEARSFLNGQVLSYDPEYELLRIQARDVSIAIGAPGASSILNVLPARILEMGASEGPRLLVKLGLGPREGTDAAAFILARITRQSRDRLDLTLGQQVHAQVKAVALME